MIIDNIWLLLSTACMNGVSPKVREALNIVTEEMIKDKFTLDTYRVIKKLDQFGSAVNLVSIDKVSKGKVDYSDLIRAVNNSGTTEDPIHVAMQVRSMHNDYLAANELRVILEKLQSGVPFDREQVSSCLSDISCSIAPVVKSEPKSFSDYVTGYMNVIEQRQANPEDTYLDIGLDVMIDKTALVVLGGQPGMGKTALALFINRYVAEQGQKTLMFSLEMEGSQLFEREVSALSKISTQQLVNVGKQGLNDEQWGFLANSLDNIDKMQVFIDDDPHLSVSILQQKCRDFKEKHPDLRLITIDYLTLMRMPEAGSRALSVGEATRVIKLLAKELKTPILLLSQLNREADKALREPRPSDLRDSGAIEQDADVIIFPYREEVHKEDSVNKGIAKIIKAKVRNGDVGSSVLKFDMGAFYESNACWQEQPKEQPKERKKF